MAMSLWPRFLAHPVHVFSKAKSRVYVMIYCNRYVALVEP